jgi:RNA polymerase sigma-70 factor (ECF subfamily)
VEEADGAVVRRVLKGEVDAYRILVERYRRQFGRYAVSLLVDADLAADAVQEAFIRAYDGLGSCRDPDRFGAWFYRILTNQCHTVRARAGTRRDAVPVEDAGLPSRERADAALEQGELAARLEAALARLTPEQREAFVLKYVDERSYEEMAALLDVSADALKMRVHRAREALRAIMGAA